MPKRINLPPYPWLLSKFLKHKLMACCELRDNIIVVCSSFIIHDIASLEHLSLTRLYQRFDNLLVCVVIIFVPFLKEGHFNCRISSLLVLLQNINHFIINTLDTASSAAFPRVILLVCAEPAGIQMWRHHKMDLFSFVWGSFPFLSLR